jgi:hypothetical protein
MIKIIVNPYPETNLSYSQWPISKDEPQRVSVQWQNKSYSLVLHNNAPVVEVWSLDKGGEIDKQEKTVPLTGSLAKKLLNKIMQKVNGH